MYVFVTIGIVLASSIILNSAITAEVDIASAQADLLIKRVFYTNECFAADDPASTPGMLDLQKFTDQRLENCLNTPYLIEAELLGEKIKAVSDPSFEDQKTLCEIKKKKCIFSQAQYVLLKVKEEYKPDVLRVSVVVPIA